MSLVLYYLHLTVCKTNIQTDIHLSLCPPSDRRQHETGAGLCVSAGLLALWQRVGLQKLCLCPHTPHTPHAGGGGGQLLVVCIHFLSICIVFLVVPSFVHGVVLCVLACDVASGDCQLSKGIFFF